VNRLEQAVETKTERKIVIHPTAIVASDARLEEGVMIGAGCVVESGSSIGAGTTLIANVYIGRNVKIGRNNRFFPTCTIGCMPQILGLTSEERVGGLEIGNNNCIREQVTIHPSMHPDGATRIGSNNLLMVGVHIGHDCIIEDDVVMSNFSQLSGHCKIEKGAWLSGMVVVHQFSTIGKWSYASGLSGINHDVPPYVIVSGHYPPRVRGINKRGLVRAGFNEEQQKNIFEAYKRLYRSKRPLLESAKDLAADNGIDENVREMAEAVIKSSQQRFGRYLEQFR
jgi:UDP-N-acetylglucosamine acyltransferase